MEPELPVNELERPNVTLNCRVFYFPPNYKYKFLINIE